jgi:hypothetical protein
MSLRLPKTSLNIRAVAIPSTNIDLIERNIDRSTFNCHLSFPKSLHHGMEVLTDCIRASIPETDSFRQIVAQSIIRQRVGHVIV